MAFGDTDYGFGTNYGTTDLSNTPTGTSSSSWGAEYFIPATVVAGMNFLGGIAQSKIAESSAKRQEAMTQKELDQARMFGGYDRASTQQWNEYQANLAQTQRDNFSRAVVNTLAGIMQTTGRTPKQIAYRLNPQTPTASSIKDSSARMFGA